MISVISIQLWFLFASSDDDGEAEDDDDDEEDEELGEEEIEEEEDEDNKEEERIDSSIKVGSLFDGLWLKYFITKFSCQQFYLPLFYGLCCFYLLFIE